jgi:protein-S-isoprenylcysteine O-methyltransferase Ste14
MLWAVHARRRHMQEVSSESKEPLLVTSGPYRLVRHPMFLWVLANGAAVSLVFRSIGGLFLVFLMVATVLRRMRWMESDASKAVPLQWSAYTRRTRRLIPGIY